MDNIPPKNFCTNIEDGRHGSITAIFEIKGIRICKSRYKLRHNTVKDRASLVVPEYIGRDQTCDSKYSTKIVGNNSSTPGPFENAIRSFDTGGPIPLVIGGSSEVNSTV